MRKLIAALAFLVTLYGCDIDSVIKTEKITKTGPVTVTSVYVETFDGGDAAAGALIGYAIGGDMTWGLGGLAIGGSAGADGCTIEAQGNGVRMQFGNLPPSVCASTKVGDTVQVAETRTEYTYESGKKDYGWYERRLVQ